MKKILLILTLFMSFVLSAQNIKTENFENFYNKFYIDKNFQFQRIKWPINTNILENYDDNEPKNYLWDKQSWNSFCKFITNKDFKSSVNQINLTKEVKEERFVDNSSCGYSLTFKLINNKWYLVFIEGGCF